MKQLFFIICFFVSSVAGASFDYQATEDIEYAADLDEWQYLLHYNAGKSLITDESFFISKTGKNNPQEELKLTIQEYLTPSFMEEEDVVCRFPARISFIKKHFNLPTRKDIPDCKKYKEFKNKVSVDDVFVVMAGENNASPSSMMGHLFLKLSGNINGIKREHSFSFFATFNSSMSIWNYIQVLFNRIDGSYILSPYSKKVDEYLFKEKRPLWEYKLKMPQDDKKILLEHLWELKEKTVKYDFITHNCGDATLNLLPPSFLNKKNYKLWETPAEKIKLLLDDNKIQDINLLPSDEYKHKMEKTHYIPDITDIHNSSKISIGYQHTHHNYLTMEFRPVYVDLTEVNNQFFDDLETKFLSFNIKYDITDNKLLLNNIDILKLTSIIDFLPDYVFSKHFKFSFENDFDETKTKLKPTLEFGLGSGFTYNIFRFYILPKIGYRYNKVHNVYLQPETGIIIKPSKKLKGIIVFQKYYDFNKNNRGFNKKISVDLSYQINEKYDLSLMYGKYYHTKSNNHNELWIKLGYHF